MLEVIESFVMMIPQTMKIAKVSRSFLEFLVGLNSFEILNLENMYCIIEIRIDFPLYPK